MKTDFIIRNDTIPVLISLAVAFGILVGAIAVLSTWTFLVGSIGTVVSVSPP
ncbi:MAG: hypothetical protein NTNFB02_02900 [Nitrospira sp.]